MALLPNENEKTDKFKIIGSVGVIATYFTEQFLKKSYHIHSIEYDNFKDDIELNGIQTLFLDNDLFESDHKWYHKHRGELMNYLKKTDLNIYIVKNTSLEIAGLLKGYPVIEICYNSKEYLFEDNLLKVPLLLDEKIFNPVNSRSKRDIVYLNIATGSVNRNHNLNFDFTKTNITQVNLSRDLIFKLIDTLRKSRILYISSTKKLDIVTIKYIEAIAELSSTITIYDHKFIDLDLDLKVLNNAVTDNTMFALLRNPQHHLRQAIRLQRQRLINNTFILNPTLKSFLHNKIYKSCAVNVSVITPTNRKHNLPNYFKGLNMQKGVVLDVVVVTHGFKLSKEEIKHFKNNFNHKLTILHKGSDITLGECLNSAIHITENDVIAKVDDDDYYYKNYLLDQWLAIQYSDADLVGKSASFYYFEIDDLYVIRRKDEYNEYCDHIMGATIMSPAKVMKDLMFSDLPRAVDSDYIRRLKKRKGSIYATHPYEMCVFRNADNEKHTWAVNDMSLYRNARVMGYGDPQSFVEI